MSRVRALRPVLACALVAPVSLAYAASFDVSGSDTAAKTLDPAGGTTQTGTVESGGNLSTSGKNIAITVTQTAGGSGDAVATISNSGTIAQTGSTRAIRNSAGAVVLGVTNNAGATISSVGDDSIQVSVGDSRFSLDNHGTISSAGGRAVNLRDAGANTINNYADGVLKSSGGDAVRPGTNGVINNYGTIQAIPPTVTSGGVIEADSDDGIQADIVSATNIPVNGVVVNNFGGGLITGRHGVTGGASTIADFSITVNNHADATISAVNGSGINIDNEGSFMGNATVNNDGTILGNFGKDSGYNTGDGDGVDVDGILTLVNNGIIRGTGAAGLGSDGGPNNPEGVSIGGGSITNNAGAEITGQDTSGSGTKGHGILSDNSSGGNAFAATTVTNAGLIRGYDSYAICFVDTFADTITNHASGVIHGGGNVAEGAAIQMGDGADTLSNAGSIIGDNGLAVDLGDGDDVMHVLGGDASISGDVSGGAGTNTLDFDPGADKGFSYNGALSNFASVEIKSGVVTLAGASTYAGATLVSGGMLVAGNSSGSATGTGLVTINTGATLGGTGTVAAVHVKSGGIIAPGGDTVPGTLSVSGDLSTEDGAVLRMRLGAASDRLDVTGNLGASGKITVNIADAGLAADTDYTLINFGSASGFSSANVSVGSLPSGFTGTVTVKSNSVVLHVSKDDGGGAFNAWTVLVMGVLGLLGLQRKTRRH